MNYYHLNVNNWRFYDIYREKKEPQTWNKQYRIVNHRLVAASAHELLRKLGKWNEKVRSLKQTDQYPILFKETVL